jgi:cobalt/nickel transport system permease protein
MLADIRVIHLPLAQTVSLGVGLLISLAFLVFHRHPDGEQAAHHHHHHSGEPDWSVPSIDDNADLHSFFHDWDPRLKIGSLFLYCFIVVSIHSVFWSFWPLIVSLLAIMASHLPWDGAIRRLKAMSGFLAMFLIVMPFTVPSRAGETLLVIGEFSRFPFHLSGFLLALKVVLKAAAIALMMEPLFATAPLAVTLNGLEGLGIPKSICQMVLLSHRYIFVFLHEMKRMYRGMMVRGFRPRTSFSTMRTVGNFMGMLFVRSFDRTQRVYDAMLSRGYNGTFPSYVHFNATGLDWAKAVMWVIIGLAMLILDRNFTVLAI